MFTFGRFHSHSGIWTLCNILQRWKTSEHSHYFITSKQDVQSTMDSFILHSLQKHNRSRKNPGGMETQRFIISRPPTTPFRPLYSKPWARTPQNLLQQTLEIRTTTRPNRSHLTFTSWVSSLASSSPPSSCSTSSTTNPS